MSGRPANARVQASKAEINHNCRIVAASKVWHPYSCYSLDTRGEDTGSPACGTKRRERSRGCRAAVRPLFPGESSGIYLVLPPLTSPFPFSLSPSPPPKTRLSPPNLDLFHTDLICSRRLHPRSRARRFLCLRLPTTLSSSHLISPRRARSQARLRARVSLVILSRFGQ